MRFRVSRAVVFGTCLVTAVLLVGVGRATTAAGGELGAARAADEAGERTKAIDHYRRALRWSLPSTSARRASISALSELGRHLEEEGDLPGALLAWRSLAGGLQSTRLLYTKEPPALAEAKDEIARLVAIGTRAPMDTHVDAETLSADHRRLLDQAPSPHPFFGALLLLGFGGWIFSLVWLIRRGFDDRGAWAWPAARWPALGAAAGLLSFVLGLLFA